MESTTGYTFTPCVGSFTPPGIDTRYKGGVQRACAKCVEYARGPIALLLRPGGATYNMFHGLSTFAAIYTDSANLKPLFQNL